jgi:hypothetical protein
MGVGDMKLFLKKVLFNILIVLVVFITIPVFFIGVSILISYFIFIIPPLFLIYLLVKKEDGKNENK